MGTDGPGPSTSECRGGQGHGGLFPCPVHAGMPTWCATRAKMAKIKLLLL